MSKYNHIPPQMKDAAQWVLWRYEERGGKPTKVPYQASGIRASTTDPAHWSTFDDITTAAYKAGSSRSGIGFVFSPDDDFFGVDLDDAIVDGVLQPWAKEVIRQLPTYAEISPSGNGLKLFCTSDPGSPKGRRVKVPDSVGVIEVYHQGRYFTVTGDVDFLGAMPLAHCQDGLDWLNATYPSKQAQSAPSTVTASGSASVCHPEPGQTDVAARAVAYIAKYPPAISGQDGHGTLFRIACVLVNGFELSPAAALQILQDIYNQTCQPPWSLRELEHKVDQATKADGPRGWLLTQQSFADSHQPVKASELGQYEAYIDELIAKPKKKELAFPAHLLHVPGFIGEVAEWIDSQNNVVQPILSLMGGIALQAALCGRKVRDKSGQRTNLYMVALAPSGGGKQAPQTCLKKILGLAGLTDLYGGKVASESALAQDLMQSPSKVWLWDEFGRFLAKSADKPGNAHLHAVQEVLLELWNETGCLWKHKSMADSKYNREVQHPCASFWGLTVAEHFWQSLEESHLFDGFAGRLLVVDTGPRGKKQDKEELPPPQSILDTVAIWQEFQAGGNLSDINPEPRLIQETKAASAIFADLVRQSDTHENHPQNSTIWSRSIEKARRLAMVYACSEDPMLPMVDDSAARWACDFIIWATDSFCTKMADEVIGGSVYEKHRKKVIDIVGAFTKRNQLCGRSYLLRHVRLPARALNEIVLTLQESGELRVESDGRGTAYTLS